MGVVGIIVAIIELITELVKWHNIKVQDVPKFKADLAAAAAESAVTRDKKPLRDMLERLRAMRAAAKVAV